MAEPTKYGDSTKYIEWSLDAAEVPVNDVNVTACFTLDAPAVAACNRADGLDCVPTVFDGTAQAREMRNFSKVNGTGIAWFQIPVVNTVTGGTTMYIQLGGPTVNVANSTAVWANMNGGGYTWSVVSHADDDVNDSGTTGNHGTFNGSAAYGTTSQFGYEAIQAGADSDYTSFPHNANLAGGDGAADFALTALGWYKPTNYTVTLYLYSKGIAAATMDYTFVAFSSDSKLRFRCFDGSTAKYRGRLYDTGIDDSGVWRQYATTYSGSDPVNNSRIYRQGQRIDDTQITAGAYTAMDGDNDVLSIGRYATGYSSFAWAVFRIGQFELSANQILQTYNIESQAATNGAFTVGALEDFGGSSSSSSSSSCSSFSSSSSSSSSSSTSLSSSSSSSSSTSSSSTSGGSSSSSSWSEPTPVATAIRLGFGVRIYLDDTAVVANAADVGLYGGTEFRWATADIVGALVAWKTGVLAPDGIGDISESVDLTDGGNVPAVGGTEVQVANTLLYGGVWTQFDKILTDNDIHLAGLRCDIVEYEYVGPRILSRPGVVRYRGIVENVNWDERVMRVSVVNARHKRRANLGTLIQTGNYPDASPDILGKMVPITFGEFKPTFDAQGNELWNGYAKFLRTANREDRFCIYPRVVLDEASGLSLFVSVYEPANGTHLFPVVYPSTTAAPGLIYHIRLVGNGQFWRAGVRLTSGEYPCDVLAGRYARVVRGQGEGSYRRIESAVLDLTDPANAIVRLTMDEYWETSPGGNAYGTEGADTGEELNSWVELISTPRGYTADVWPCQRLLDANGNPTYTEPALYSHVEPKSAQATGKVTENAMTFIAVPPFAITVAEGNNQILLSARTFIDMNDQLETLLTVPFADVQLMEELIKAGNGGSWRWLVGEDYNITQPGFYTAAGYPVPQNRTYYDIARVLDRKRPGYFVMYSETTGAGGNGPIVHALRLEMPPYPSRFDPDGVYLGIRGTTMQWGDVTHPPHSYPYWMAAWRSWWGPVKRILNSYAEPYVYEHLILDNIPDSYYSPAAGTANYGFNIHRKWVAVGGPRYFNGWRSADFGINPLTKENYEGVRDLGLFMVARSWSPDGLHQVAQSCISELCVMFSKTISIKDAIFAPMRGRIYGATWGQAAGSSSSSSSSSSQSSPSVSSSSSSSSSSNSSSSQSSPSVSSSSSSSPSFSSASSPSSSSSSSSACPFGAAGRKRPCALIDNPPDIAEHILRLQNWSEQGETKDWGHEYASVPLIDVSTSEGGFDYEDLDRMRGYRPAWQIQEHNEAWSDAMIASLCREYFLVQHQDPATGRERLSQFAFRSLTTPTDVITLAEIIDREIRPVEMPLMKGIYCEPVMHYCRNNATGEYEKTIKISNVSAPVYSPDYVIGLTGLTAEYAWTRCHALWRAHRQIEDAPASLTDCPSIVTDKDAVDRLDTWLTWMGAISDDGTLAGVRYDPKRRISFTVPYEIGRGWALMHHIRLQLPHQTDGAYIEAVIVGYRKSIRPGHEQVEVDCVLYGACEEISLYVKDTWDTTTRAHWKDTWQEQAIHGEGADVKDIT